MLEGAKLAAWSRAVRESTLKRLRRVPEGSENWRPVPGAMSFADLAHHLAEADRWLFRKLEEPSLSGMVGEAGEGRVAARSDFIALLADLEVLGAERVVLLERLDSAALDATAFDDRFGGEVTVWWVIVRGNLDHEVHHRGQIATYLRQIQNENG